MITRDALHYLARIGGTLRTGEVAEVLNITPADVRRLTRLSDGLNAVRDGRRTRSYLARDIVSWLHAHPEYPLPDGEGRKL